MILDRSPEEEPLIPAERTKIRLEMVRKRSSSKCQRRATWAGKVIDDADPGRIEPVKDIKIGRGFSTMMGGKGKAKESKDEKPDTHNMSIVFGKQTEQRIRSETMNALIVNENSVSGFSSEKLQLCGSLGLCGEENALKTNGAMNNELGKGNERPQANEEDDWRLRLRAMNERRSRKGQQDLNTKD